MTAFVLVRLMTAGALLAAAAGPALAQAPKPWKHGIIAPKADAGFLLMAAKRGFAEKEGLKLELLEVKDDQIGLKALLAGELDSYEGGVQGAIAVNVRGGDVKIMGCHWVVVPHGIMVKAGIDKIEDLKGKAVAVSAPGSFPDMLARLALAKFKIAPSEVTLAAGRRRSRPLHRAGRRRGRAGRGVERIPAAGELEGAQDAAGGQGRAAEFRAHLHVLHVEGAGRAARGRDPLSHRAVEGAALRARAPGRDRRARGRGDRRQARRPAPGFVFDDAVKVGAIAPDLPLPMDKLAWMQEQMVALGQIPKAGDLAKMVNTDIRAQAVERAGK